MVQLPRHPHRLHPLVFHPLLSGCVRLLLVNARPLLPPRPRLSPSNLYRFPQRTSSYARFCLSFTTWSNPTSVTTGTPCSLSWRRTPTKLRSRHSFPPLPTRREPPRPHQPLSSARHRKTWRSKSPQRNHRQRCPQRRHPMTLSPGGSRTSSAPVCVVWTIWIHIVLLCVRPSPKNTLVLRLVHMSPMQQCPSCPPNNSRTC
mmetsp:Transcript_14925/g.44702  ORF Transcript_14925/g.44702 Transcript_14925/m.44702 type:complete len:202 (-) Transcript_14925:1270-1875(-)